jgi:predicted permease
MSVPAPPKVAVMLLGLVTHEDDRASLLADLETGFVDRADDPARARRWYWRQTIGSIPALLWRRAEIARREAGGRTTVQQRGALFAECASDVRHAWRLIRRTPIVSVSVVTAIALGIAAVTAIVSVMEGVFLRSLPFPDAHQLVQVGTEVDGFGRVPDINFLDASDFRQRSTTLSSIACYAVNPTAVRLSPGQLSLSATVLVAGADLDRVLGVHPEIGRWFDASEQVVGGKGAVLVSQRFWRQHLGADADVVGRHMDIGGADYTIVGVLPAAASRFPTGGADLWTPLTFPPDSFLNQRGSIALEAVGRLRPGVTESAARADLSAISMQLAAEHPDTNGKRRATIENLQDAMVGPIRPMMLTLAGAIVLLLAVACLNIANLLLAHVHARTREFGIRAAIGASRGRLLRQLGCENLTLFAMAGAVGIASAGPLARAIVRWYPGELPLAADIQIDGRVLAAAALVTFGVMLLALVPQAIGLRRSTIVADLEGGARIGLTRSHRRITSAFIVVQVAMSTVLLTGGVLLLRTFTNLTAVSPGFSPDGITLIRVSLPADVQRSPEAMVAFQDRVRDVAASVPGVEGAAHAMFVPFTSGSWGDVYRLPGDTRQGPNGPIAHFYMVSPDYLSVLQVPLVRGRGLTPSDSAGGARVLVVSEAFARQAFGRVDVVGQHIDWNGDYWTIVGVARDVRHESLWQAPDADAYVPRTQVPRSPTWLVLRTKQPGQIVAGQIYERLKAEAPQLALTDATTMSRLLETNVAPERFRALVTGVIAALSLVLAVVGLHGVVAYAVSRRSREIGVRIALGARRSTVLGQIFRESGRVVAFGLVPGIGGAVVLARWLSSQGVVQASVSGAIGATVAIFAAAAFIATFTPARRASRVDPVSVLRSE